MKKITRAGSVKLPDYDEVKITEQATTEQLPTEKLKEELEPISEITPSSVFKEIEQQINSDPNYISINKHYEKVQQESATDTIVNLIKIKEFCDSALNLRNISTEDAKTYRKKSSELFTKITELVTNLKL